MSANRTFTIKIIHHGGGETLLCFCDTESYTFGASILTGKSRTDHHPITVLKGLHYKERKIPNSISIQVLF